MFRRADVDLGRSLVAASDDTGRPDKGVEVDLDVFEVLQVHFVGGRAESEVSDNAGCTNLDGCCHKVGEDGAEKSLGEAEHHDVLALKSRRLHGAQNARYVRFAQGALDRVGWCGQAGGDEFSVAVGTA